MFYNALGYAVEQGHLPANPVDRALRPSEAVMLRESDLHLPKTGWGRIVLAASASRAGTAWADHGTACQERGLKHRAAHETRTIPIPPEL